ncbi:hypothetical protein ACQ1Q1_09335 [Ornithobacterium rhinotracheale]|uniref:hypothetical protein n=1 Tax=Ornithobacterium rhinotracheale TaxID=28251 RepID=UPI00129D113D|nr:hypothetical protein [Ornithobacterium rhinotracheale]MCK0200658.1 hypothetical protein [Ornithobacterium rhinotracheale]MCK0203338.1 hypothetical protein [Ornithobacterium rhinotracheale]MCK0203361.1 hypothetical protein [Ornithobacterium rhinotracheale]MRI63661.1 hypothetical protein [Ornithobacterium rhinotracheale]MRJ09180.1 hypothetical protein [Ornithobacterium rhinotracheale]
MKKVTIKLNPAHLNAMLIALEEVPTITGKAPAQMAVQSIFDELLTKLLKKQVEKRNEPQKKEFKLILKYYEAYALSEVLMRVRELLSHDSFYEKHSVLMINSQIFEQLQP